MTTFIRVLDASVDEKPAALLQAVGALCGLGQSDAKLPPNVFERNAKAFAEVPGSPFAYWVSERSRSVFMRFLPLESERRTVKHGAATLDDFRFLRTWWEVSFSQSVVWVPFAKGGAFSPHYADVQLTLKWAERGVQVKAFVSAKVGSASRTIQATDYYFRPGLTWPLRTQIGFGIRAMPAGCIFGHKGPAAFVDGDDPDQLLALLAITTSSTFCFLVELQMAFGSYEVGVIQRTPVPNLSSSDVTLLASLARRAWSLKRTLDTTNETSHAFVLPPGTRGYEAVAPNHHAGGFHRATIEQELVEIQLAIDDRAFALYGIGPEDRAAIEQASKRGPTAPAAGDTENGEEPDEGEDAEDAPVAVPILPTISWLVGVAFGRFDKRLATGERALPAEPEPFDPLPARSPGMWPADEKPPSELPDILVDDPGHERDLARHVALACENTGFDVSDDLRQWLAKEFFPLHIKMYSKSRRKAPIYWQLATPSASYSVWLYIHAASQDTLFRMQNDYAGPKLAHEERRLQAMEREMGERAAAAERKLLASQEALVEELRAFLDEVKRVAPLWKPNLDDGVLLSFAPLWRLVPQHKAWQKELKAAWSALCEGKYDWAQLAMHLWPERVVPKCKTDRSLAIAHGLEDAFWVENMAGKWAPREEPARPMEDLVRERTSPAAKAALKSLLEAPVAAHAGGRGRGGGKRKAL